MYCNVFFFGKIYLVVYIMLFIPPAVSSSVWEGGDEGQPDTAQDELDLDAEQLRREMSAHMDACVERWYPEYMQLNVQQQSNTYSKDLSFHVIISICGLRNSMAWPSRSLGSTCLCWTSNSWRWPRASAS